MNDPNKPAGVAEDFNMMTPYERELRAAKAKQDPEVAFRMEMQAIETEKARVQKERADFEAGIKAPPPPTKIFHLLVAKQNGRFRVAGMYSDRPKLAAAIAGSVMEYSAAGAILGAVDFDLAIKLDQPPPKLS